MLALVGGSGLGRPAHVRAAQQVDTPWGEPSGPVLRLAIAGEEVLFLARHGDPHRLPPHRINYRANIHALRASGATRLLLLNTVGGIDPALVPGTLVVPHDLIDYTYGRDHTFHDGGVPTPPVHVEFATPFDTGMREQLAGCLRAAAVAHRLDGVYGATQGPRLETAAEIRRMARDGCDIVGMTGMPEVALAREAGLRCAMLSLVVNPAAGVGEVPISMAAIAAVQAAGLARAWQVVEAFVGDGITSRG